MTPIVSRMTRGLAVSAAVLAAFALLDGAVHALLAQNPFGAPRAAEPQGGLVGWLLAKQSEFYREISQTIRAAKSDGSAVWTLLVISFAYGIFHAAGPGHGKAVISSYMVANRETARRGIVLSFASALMQSVVAVLIVGICAWLLNATAKTMCGAEKAVEIASYALIAAFGARLVWVKGGGFFRALQAPGPALAMAGAHQHDHDHHDHDHHDHGHDHHHRHAHDDHGHHLVFALAQGLFWAGIAATFVMGLGTAITVAAIALVAVSARGVAERLSAARDGGGMVIMRGLEFAAAGLVLLFGLGLLFGYVAAERATCL